MVKLMHNEVLEELTVVKRSGQRVAFNASKVAIAIKKAFDSVDNSDDKKIFKVFEKVLNFINNNYRERKTINVEDIQDIIESTLYNEKYYDVYNAFKDYRQKRALSRKVFAEKQQHKFVRAIEKIEESTLNKDNSKCANDLIYDFGRIISSEYAKSYVLDTKSFRAAEEGNIYIHDLDYFSLGIFPKVHIKLEVNEDTDIDLLINNIIQIEKEVFEEISVIDIDRLLSPIILYKFKTALKDNLKKYLKLMGFLELVNYSNIEKMINDETSYNIDIKKYQAFMVNEHLLEIMRAAIEDAKSYVDEISVKILMKIFNALELRTERQAKYTISFGLDDTDFGKLLCQKIYNILSKNTFLKINFIVKINGLDMDVTTRIAKILETNDMVGIHFIQKYRDINYFIDGTRIYENANDNENNSIGRMVVSSTSVNLARLGLKFHNKKIDEFYRELEIVVEQVKNELLLAFETIGGKNKNYYQVLFKGNILDDEKLEIGQKIRKVIKNGILNIGIIGLKECVCCLEKDSKKQLKILSDILNYLNEKCDLYTRETKLNFGLCEPVDIRARKKLLAIDKAIYGCIAEVNDKKTYDLLDVDMVETYKELAKYQQKFAGGKLVQMNLSKKATLKKVADALEMLNSSKIEFARLVVGKDEY
ncbi:MAG: hypothetical protein E7164_01075 [Firmicutes bacterium]|nr:hypothetical protein [Bacillota bacterium]